MPVTTATLLLPWRRLRRRHAFSALTQTVLLYGCAAWALAPAELERLKVVQRALLRQALPLARRRDVSTEKLDTLFCVQTVATLWSRAQLR